MLVINLNKTYIFLIQSLVIFAFLISQIVKSALIFLKFGIFIISDLLLINVS